MRAMSPAGREAGPKPGTGPWISSTGRPNFSATDQEEGKQSEATASRAPSAPHQHQVLLHQQRGRQQWRVILRSDSVACGERRFALSCAGEVRREAADQMVADECEDLLLRGKRLRLGAEYGIAVARDKLSPLRERWSS